MTPSLVIYKVSLPLPKTRLPDWSINYYYSCPVAAQLFCSRKDRAHHIHARLYIIICKHEKLIFCVEIYTDTARPVRESFHCSADRKLSLSRSLLLGRSPPRIFCSRLSLDTFISFVCLISISRFWMEENRIQYKCGAISNNNI